MTDEEIYEKLTATFRAVFDDDSLVAKPSLSAEDVAEWDSLSHVRLILTVAKEFNVQFAASEVAELKNVGDLAALLKLKTSGPAVHGAENRA